MRKNKNFKKLMILAIAAVMCLSAITIVGSAAYIELGDPLSTSYESYVPFYGFYDYSWSAVIYLQSELGGAKAINGLTYDVYFQQVYTIYNQKIWMKHTTDTDWVGNYVKPDPVADGYTLVFEGDLTFTDAHWADPIALDTDFNYNGADNLIIYWENWDGDYISGQPRWYYPGSSYAPNRVKYRYSDGSMPGDATSASYYFPNIRLHFPTNHDVTVKDIVMPETVEGYGNVPVHVAVKNVGLNTESFPVNVKINAPPTYIAVEDFESCTVPYEPPGWLVKDMNLDGYISGSYAYNMWGSYSSSSYAHSGLISMRMDYGGSGGDDDWLFTPGLPLTAGVTYVADWWDRMSSSSTSYDNQLEVWIGTTQDNTGMTTMLWQDTAMYHTTYREDSVSFTVPTTDTYYIGAHRVNGYSYANMYVDDVSLYIPGSTIYDQTVTMTSLSPGSVSEANLPDWVVASPGTYEVIATTLLAGDENTMDDQMTQYTTVGFYDASTDSIDIPHTLMGPASFDPVATVSNVGSMDFNGDLPVHATVLDPSGGTGVCFTEDFETPPSLNVYDGDNEVIINPEEVAKSGEYTRVNGIINWGEDDEPSLSDTGDWTVLNPDNNGAMWHWTDYRYSSPTHSMYCGDENLKQYLPDSMEILISPKIHIGNAGGTFDFDLYNDVEGGGYDDVYFGFSPNGMSWGWWFGGSWWATWLSATGVPIFPGDADANGDGYVGFLFVSDSSWEYEGPYVDNVVVHGSPYLYDETVFTSLASMGTTQVTFPTFTPLAGYGSYTINVCCESPLDSVPANDCGSLAFSTNAPAWNARTGYGYPTIQAAIDDVYTIDGDTIVANDGNFYEDLNIWKQITVTGLNPPTGGTSYLYGTVDIVMDNVIFENFYVKPLTLFTTDQAAIAIYSNHVIVRNNIVEIEGETTGTIKGIHAYAVPSDFKQDIEISNNIVRDVKNMLGCVPPTATTILFEDFEGSWIPSGWTVIDNMGSCVWERNDYYGRTNYLNGMYSACADEDWCWAPMDTELRTPIFSLTGYTDATLDYMNYFYSYSSYDQYGDVDISTDGGSTWTNLMHYWGGTFGPGPESIPLTSYVGNANCQIRFHFFSIDWAYYWEVDDVEISGVGGGGPGGYGGAVGIMVQGAEWDVNVLDNEVYDVHSPGWSHGIEVTPTALDPVTQHFQAFLDFQEDFTGLATGAIPTGWSIDPVVTNWGAYPSNYAGGVSPEMRFYYSPSATDDFYLMTPQMDTSAFTTLDFSFSHYINHYTTPYTLKVVALTNGGANEYEIDSWQPTSTGGPYYESYTLTAADGVGASDFQLAWVFSGYSWNINYWYFDDVVLHGAYDYYKTVYPWPENVNIEGNHIYRISKGPGYTCAPPTYDGIMLTIDVADLPSYGPTPADASEVMVYHNWFDPECFYPCLAILNMDLGHCLMAGNNYFGYPDGPGSFDPTGFNMMVYDCLNGQPANGGGSQIVLYGPVHFYPYLGLKAIHNIVSPYYATTGVSVLFDGRFSWAKDFAGVGAPYQFYWKFDDGHYSMMDTIAHTYTAPGTYDGYLRVMSLGIPEFGIPPQYDWAYFTIIVTPPDAPLSANAGGGSLGHYEVPMGETIMLSGLASGGTQPYTYSWDLGNGKTSQVQNPIVKYKDSGTYTVTLTVVDANYDVATDTATVTVLGPGELVVSITAPANAQEQQSITFQSTVLGGTPTYSYSWDFGDSITSTLKTPVHIYENAGTYTVTLTVTDSLGATKTATHTIVVEGESASSDPQIIGVKGIFGVKATIAAGDSDCDWTINVDGKYVFSGGSASGTIPANMQQTVQLPLTIALGKVTITVTANEVQKDYTAFALGPFFLKLEEA